MSDKIGRFEILSELSKSASGTVYKASDPESGQNVAVKLLHVDSSTEAGKQLMEQVLAEAESTKSLNSHNLAVLYGAGDMDGQFCAGMEYVQGNSISTMIARKEGFSIWDLLDISRQACQGLDHAHVQGVFHHSLEPAKVMVQWDGMVKILGFGISRMGSAAISATGAAPEVLHYMSPEQLRGEPLDARSNLFSWGAILYEMITERKAFDGADADAVRQAILETTPPPPNHVVPKVSAGLSEVILRAIAKDPSQRFQSGQDLVNELEACKENATKAAAAKKSTPAQGLNIPGKAAPAPAKAVSKPAATRPPAATQERSAEPVDAATPQAAEVNEHAPVADPVATKPRAAAAAAGAHSFATVSSTPSVASHETLPELMGNSVAEHSTTHEPARMSAAPTPAAEPEAPSIHVDPMMVETDAEQASGPSFSELSELPPLKEIYVAPPEPAPAPEAAAPVAAALPQAAPEKPKVQPREVARKAVKEIKKTPPKLFVYSISAAVVIMLLAVVWIAFRIHSENADEDSTPVAATSAPAQAEPAPAQAAPPVAAPAPQETVAVEPSVVEQAPASVRRGAKRKAPAPAPVPVVTPGQLMISSSPEGAQIQIDGKTDPAWVTPFNVAGLNPGQHTISLLKQGYASDTRAVDVASGSKSFLTLQLAPLGASVALASEPAGASIYVDGHDSGKTTPAQLNVDKGSHTFLVRKAGYLDETSTVNLQAGQNFHFAPALRALGMTDDIKTSGGNKLKKLFGGKDAQAGMGTITLRTTPKGAQIAVNRRILDKASPVEFYLNPGNYMIDITLSGYKPLQRVVTVEKSGKLVLDETLTPE